MSIAIKVENLSKIYQIGEIGTGTLSRDMERWWVTKVMGKEDPFLKIGQINDRSKKGESDIVYSLQDINFEIEQGDAVGIIGKNGAGKSTLLKILSRITSPTTGKIQVKGRVASLLEVGTGFHPELTGRDNIYLNGAILGMRKREITRKLDEIIDFSGVERYIDTPVKRYSSGMYVRLAFAVAAHLESEILIVDEVLAVGDAEFQKKCLGKMGEVTKGEGRTVLFVSHNMASVKSLCQKGVLLENGWLALNSSADETIQKYMGQDSVFSMFREINIGSKGFILQSVSIRNEYSTVDTPLYRDKVIKMIFNYINQTEDSAIYFNVRLKDEEGRYFLLTTSLNTIDITNTTSGTAIMHIPAGFLNEGNYGLDLMVLSKTEKGYRHYVNERDVIHFQILPEVRPFGSWMGKEVGYIRHQFEWTQQ